MMHLNPVAGYTIFFIKTLKVEEKPSRSSSLGSSTPLLREEKGIRGEAVY